MKIKVVYFGDIVGRPGRELIEDKLPVIREKYDPDLVLANVENASHGRGINRNHYEYFKKLGIDGMTTGDHVWHFSDILEVLNAKNGLLLRPANYAEAPGKGYLDIEVMGKRVRLINLIGRAFMNGSYENPFLAFDELVAIDPKPDLIIVDFHAEATSEKRAFAEYVDGRASLVVGTHTHIPTSDTRKLEKGTLSVTDLGMNGPVNSVIGAKKDGIIKSFLTGLPWSYSVSEGECELGAVYCEIDLTEPNNSIILRIDPLL